MNRILRHPATNAVCLSVFSGFYCAVFLLSGTLPWLAAILTALTAVIVGILCLRRAPYDEYHTARLTGCLVISLSLVLAALGLFTVWALLDPTELLSKLMGFITVQWAVVVLSDLVYILLCRWR